MNGSFLEYGYRLSVVTSAVSTILTNELSSVPDMLLIRVVGGLTLSLNNKEIRVNLFVFVQ